MNPSCWDPIAFLSTLGPPRFPACRGKPAAKSPRKATAWEVRPWPGGLCENDMRWTNKMCFSGQKIEFLWLCIFHSWLWLYIAMVLYGFMYCFFGLWSSIYLIQDSLVFYADVSGFLTILRNIGRSSNWLADHIWKACCFFSTKMMHGKHGTYK